MEHFATGPLLFAAL